MKTIKSLKFIMAVTAFVLLLKSCKKVDNNASASKAAIAALTAQKESIKKAIQAKYGNVSAGFVYNVNKTANNLQYKNTDGKMVSANAIVQQAQNNSFGGPVTNSLCRNCNTATSVSQLKQVYTLDYVQRFYMCEGNTNSNVLVSWTVNVPYNFVSPPLVSPPFGHPTPTFNTIQLRFTTAGGGSSINLNSPPNGPVYTVVGTDPTCASNHIYTVTYLFQGVPNSYFTAGATLDAKLEMNNDCALVPGKFVSTGYITVPSSFQNEDQPCNRIDMVYVNPGTGPANCATASCNTAICAYPMGITLPDEQEVEYRQVNNGGTVWDDQSSNVNWGAVPFAIGTTPSMPIYGGQLNLLSMIPGSGTWLVRYRNVKTSVCDIIYGPFGNPNGTWPANLWVTEVWAL